jgi:transcriptional regulator with XRE-family HTH domain
MSKNFKLKARIVEKYGTQVDFAVLVGISQDRLSKFIHGRSRPNPLEARRIAKKLGVSQGELFAGGQQ